MRPILSLLIALLALSTAAEESPAYRISRPIIGHDEGRQNLLAVPLDASVYAVCAEDFRDLRIKDQHGADTPYLLQKIAGTKTEVRRLPVGSKIESLRKIGDDGIVVAVKLDEDESGADGLTIVTGQKDFEYGIRVHGSVDGLEWKSLVDNALIYDYSRYLEVANRDIEMPANDFRHFNITVTKAKQTRAANLIELTRTLRGSEELQRLEKFDLHYEPLRIGRIDFWRNQTETLPEANIQFEYPVEEFKISHDAEHKTTVIDIGTRRQPLTGFSLKTRTPNFSRRAEVQIPLRQGMASRLQTIAGATLEALNFHDISRERKHIEFQEQRRTHYRIVIHDQDSPPLDIDGIGGVGNGYRLLFLTEPGKSYRLHYGDDKTEPASYDTAPIRELLRRGYRSAAAELGPETASGSIEESLNFGKLLSSRWFLVGAITLMVAVLAWSLYRIGKRVGELPK